MAMMNGIFGIKESFGSFCFLGPIEKLAVSGFSIGNNSSAKFCYSKEFQHLVSWEM